jgi:diaminopimelate epimerase
VTVAFTKVEGLGNDFIVLDRMDRDEAQLADEIAWAQALAPGLCDRRRGIGADGVLIVGPPSPIAGTLASMTVINFDGSRPEMCGNGLRCVAKYLVERDRLEVRRITIDTGAGPLTCELSGDGDGDGDVIDTVTVDMGRPRLRRDEIPMTGPGDQRCVAAPFTVKGRELALTAVSMGNPHAVAFVDESGPELRRLAEAVGPEVETHVWFPRRTNVELARVHGPREIELVVWERGCGITLACGTGACATAVAACLNGLAEPDVEIAVRLLGGELAVRVLPDYRSVLMRGPAVHVFDAEIDLATLDGRSGILPAP